MGHLAAPEADGIDTAIDKEIDVFMRLSLAEISLGDKSTYFSNGFYDVPRFYSDHRGLIPVHTQAWRSTSGCVKGASANCETVFSGAGAMASTANTLGSGVFGAKVWCHYNWQFLWLRPSVEEVASEYKSIFGKDAHLSDGESSDSDVE